MIGCSTSKSQLMSTIGNDLLHSPPHVPVVNLLKLREFLSSLRVIFYSVGDLEEGEIPETELPAELPSPSAQPSRSTPSAPLLPLPITSILNQWETFCKATVLVIIVSLFVAAMRVPPALLEHPVSKAGDVSFRPLLAVLCQCWCFCFDSYVVLMNTMMHNDALRSAPREDETPWEKGAW
jgi:hypothetical protein